MKKFLLLLSLVGCASTSEPEEYSGIRQTDINGRIIVDDTDDWKSIPTGCTDMCLIRNLNAFPNPTADNATIKLEVQNAYLERMSLYDKAGKLLQEIPVGTDVNGVVTYILHTGDIPAGIYRLKVRAKLHEASSETYETYGDIEVK